MENPTQGDKTQISNQFNQTTPIPVVSSTYPSINQVPNNNLPQNVNTDVPHTNRASTIILQWLTYAFWGWTILFLSILSSIVFTRLIVGADFSIFAYYIIAAVVVLFITAMICDFIYTPKEPLQKTGPSSAVMIIHAVIFALFAIFAILLLAWNIVALLTSSTNYGVSWAGIISLLFIILFYSTTFFRTLNPAHISWVPKIYRIFMTITIVIFCIVAFIKPTFAKNLNTQDNSFFGLGNTSQPTKDTFSGGNLQPTAVDYGQCNASTLSDGSQYGQIAISGSATCQDAATVIGSAQNKNGGAYSSGGYKCKSTLQSASNQEWGSYYNGSFYTYSCINGSSQIAFNWQSSTQASGSNAGSSGSSSSSLNPQTNNQVVNGALQPTEPGDGECSTGSLTDGSGYAQVAISGSAQCSDVTTVAQGASGKNGAEYTADGYSCSSVLQSADNQEWGSYYDSAFYSYSCSSSTGKIAFNLQTASQSSSASAISQ